MADFGQAEKYVAPERALAPAKYVDEVKQFTDQGIDTVFPVTVNTADVAAEKLQVQRSVNEHGFSARVVSSEDNGKGKTTIKFRVRPGRKPRGSAEGETEAAPAE